ncbi:ATP-binding cassette domain-containing protein [Streptacidiphilus sp. N1-10]|uniref:ATP-binding cassette domain-containing protein n=1 Tax=Streptacidiphilus jeojiensis TaxID=3229225 RepID=A0ABV6XUZ0_9ACTN
MFQAIGLTKSWRRGRPPALLDLSFDAREGQVTVLLGAEGSGRTTALRLALGLDRGQGVALFDGRPYRRIRRPEREVGAVLGDPGRHTGHPGREARGHLRMVAAAVGVPARRADQLLEQTRLAPAAGHRLRTFSPGMSRRLALAEALLGDPGTLLLDEPTHGLSPKNTEWFHAFLRAFAAGGGTVLATVRDPREAAALADRVVTLDGGRLMADQAKADFVGSRLRDEVSVRGPQVGRLADLLTESGAQVRREGGAGIAVVGASRTQIGELAYRHGILLHELADRAAGSSSGPGIAPAPAPVAVPQSTSAGASALPPPSAAPAQPGETVVVLTPGSAVSASVPVPTADTATRSRVPAGLASVSGPLYRDEPPASDQRSE